MGMLYNIETHTVNYHLKKYLPPVNYRKIQLFENFEQLLPKYASARSAKSIDFLKKDKLFIFESYSLGGFSSTAYIPQRGDSFSFVIPSPFQHLQRWIKTRSKNPADGIYAKRLPASIVPS
jgi:hypothetical protein